MEARGPEVWPLIPNNLNGIILFVIYLFRKLILLLINSPLVRLAHALDFPVHALLFIPQL